MPSGELKITVEKSYLENMKNAADALNKFISSNFVKKDFPIIDEDNSEELEPCLFHMLTWMNRLDVKSIHRDENIESMLDDIREIPQKYGKYENIMNTLIDNNDEKSIEKINSYIAYQMASYMKQHQKELAILLEGISSMNLFGIPSEYKQVLDLFSDPIPLNDIDDIINDEHYCIFDEEIYVKGFFHSDEIYLPKELKLEKELNRFKNRQSYQSFSVVENDEEIDHIDVAYQEQAEINFFSMVNPNHIRYHQNKFQPSQQFVKVIKQLISGLKKCDTPEDVKDFLNDKHNHVNPDDYTCMVLPTILARIFNDPKLFQNRLFNEKNLKKYIDSYDSIYNQDKNVRQFKDYDLLSTFKADKQGTIQFLEDFLSLKLVSDPNAYISNHTLLVLFNIFDSRIYLDILYNVLPQSEKKGDYETEDGFVKTIRARINENSNKSNTYTAPKKEKTMTENSPNVLPTSGQVTEYALNIIHDLGDFDINDGPYIGKVISEACYLELSTLHDKSFKVGISESDIMKYLGNLYQETQGYFINGRVPNYMADRIKTTDAQGKPNIEVEPTEVPEGIPTNDIGSLIDSIDERVDEVQPDENGNMDLSDGFGKDAEVNPNTKGSQVVYNITYNYHNSNNTTTTTDSHNTIDRSINKTVSGTSNNNYNRNNRKRIIPMQNVSPENRGSNNNNNDTSFSNTKDDITQIQPNSATFSTGKSVQEVFDLLKSKEPLLVEEGAKQTAGGLIGAVGADTGVLPDTNPEPKEDLLTKAQNFDMKMLSKQEIARKAANKAVQTGRAIKQPFERTRDWIQNFVDDLLQRNEDETKARILEDDNFRTQLRKVFHLALNFEMLSVAYVLSPYLALVAGVVGGSQYINARNMKKDVQNELAGELEIIDDKIKRAKAKNTQAGYNEAYELMRIKRKLLDKATKVTKDPFARIQPLKNSRSTYDWD
jgi:hypothetical protein